VRKGSTIIKRRSRESSRVGRSGVRRRMREWRRGSQGITRAGEETPAWPSKLPANSRGRREKGRPKKKAPFIILLQTGGKLGGRQTWVPDRIEVEKQTRWANQVKKMGFRRELFSPGGSHDERKGGKIPATLGNSTSGAPDDKVQGGRGRTFKNKRPLRMHLRVGVGKVQSRTKRRKL